MPRHVFPDKVLVEQYLGAQQAEADMAREKQLERLMAQKRAKEAQQAVAKEARGGKEADKQKGSGRRLSK